MSITAAYCRERARHMRQLAESILDTTLREGLYAMARDYDEVAEDLESGAETVRHPELLGEPLP
jgi:hypothetical protein